MDYSSLSKRELEAIENESEQMELWRKEAAHVTQPN
jgi:hypothetical protein